MWYTEKMGNKKACTLASVIFLVLLVFPLAVGLFFYNDTATLKQGAIDDRQTIVGIIAAAVQVKISHLVNIASLMASNNNIVIDVASDQWGKAANVTRDLQNNVNYYDTYIDRIILIDAKGVERSAYPELIGGIGADFSNLSPFQKLLGGAPYAISNVTLRVSHPQVNIINVLVPISTQGKIVGVIGLQVPTSNFLEFGSDASLGAYGFTYLIDSAGNIVASPKFSSGESIVNIASTSIAQKALSGNAGYYVTNNNTDNGKSIIAYAPVPVHEWGVVLQEPYNEVFGGADSIIRIVEIGSLVFIILDGAMAYVAFRLFKKKRKHHE